MSVRFGKHDSELCSKFLNLLAHAQAIELDIGSECGGHGICGKDRLQLNAEELKKVSPPTEHEREHLSATELAQGWRLGCQTFPNADHLEIQTTPRK